MILIKNWGQVYTNFFKNIFRANLHAWSVSKIPPNAISFKNRKTCMDRGTIWSVDSILNKKSLRWSFFSRLNNSHTHTQNEKIRQCFFVQVFFLLLGGYLSRRIISLYISLLFSYLIVVFECFIENTHPFGWVVHRAEWHHPLLKQQKPLHFLFFYPCSLI